MNPSLLRLLPAVHELKKHPFALELRTSFALGETYFTKLVQRQLTSLRKEILAGEVVLTSKEAITELFFTKLERLLQITTQPTLQKVINASGTVLHTNLGRARLSETAIKHLLMVARNYSNVEYRLADGRRSSRHEVVEDLVKELTGAEAAMVVNNNAAAVFLVLSALARGQEVVVSRGELVEIGGSFRISSIMTESGALLREVGTTNKTRLTDYSQAISEETAMLLKVHTSNYKVIGFTESTSSKDLFALAKAHGLISYEDLGSGALFDFAKVGIGEEPLIASVVADGADLVSFSGDKLLGGPQSGIIAGKQSLIEVLKKHQLARVLRVDKLTLAALEATLLDYLKGLNVEETIPTLQAILNSAEQVKKRAEWLVSLLQDDSLLTIDCWVQADQSTIGGGTMPGVEIPTYCVGLKNLGCTMVEMHEKMRRGTISVVGKVKADCYWLDMRTVLDEEVEEVAIAIQQSCMDEEKIGRSLAENDFL